MLAGRVCVPFDAAKVADFEPSAVPTIRYAGCLGLTLFLTLHRVPKKTCDHIFYNNFNNNCPITIIFGIVSSKSMRHRKMVSFPTSTI